MPKVIINIKRLQLLVTKKLVPRKMHRHVSFYTFQYSYAIFRLFCHVLNFRFVNLSNTKDDIDNYRCLQRGFTGQRALKRRVSALWASYRNYRTNSDPPGPYKQKYHISMSQYLIISVLVICPLILSIRFRNTCIHSILIHSQLHLTLIAAELQLYGENRVVNPNIPQSDSPVATDVK